MMHSLFLIVSRISIFLWSIFALSIAHATTTYTPGTTISMTGSNSEVYFDVADDIYTS
jgi:hypothetical protein